MRTTRGALVALAVVSSFLGVVTFATPPPPVAASIDAVAVGIDAAAVSTGDYIVGFDVGTDEASAREAALDAGLQPLRWNSALGTLLVRPAAADTDQALTQSTIDTLEAQVGLRYLEPNIRFEGAAAPDDPEYVASQQWAVDKIGAPEAFDVTTGSSSVTIGVLDTGLDMTHPDIDGSYANGYDFVNDDNDPTDDHGHGTHVSGIVGANTDNAVGVASIGHETMILPVKVLDHTNNGSAADIADGITWAADQGADVINMSFASTSNVQAVQDAVNYAYDAGVLLVAAVGNNLSTVPRYPAAYTATMGVSATDQYDRHFMLSNRGSFVAMSAPGVSIKSTDMLGNGSYTSRSGTSMAAAHVSAVAALMLAVDGSLEPDDLRSMLESTSVDLGDPGYDHEFGHGRLDAEAAVDEANSAPPPTATPTPSPTPQPTATPTPSGPTLTNIRARRVRSTSARILWTCSEPCTAQVEYGTSPSMGTFTAINHNLTTRPKRNLSGLSRGTTYYYRPISENSSGGVTVGPVKTFTTRN